MNRRTRFISQVNIEQHHNIICVFGKLECDENEIVYSSGVAPIGPGRALARP